MHQVVDEAIEVRELGLFGRGSQHAIRGCLSVHLPDISRTTVTLLYRRGIINVLCTAGIYIVVCGDDYAKTRQIIPIASGPANPAI